MHLTFLTFNNHSISPNSMIDIKDSCGGPFVAALKLVDIIYPNHLNLLYAKHNTTIPQIQSQLESG